MDDCRSAPSFSTIGGGDDIDAIADLGIDLGVAQIQARCGFVGSTASQGLSASCVVPLSEATCSGLLQVLPPSLENDTDGPMR
jgi:hypothetical protein